MNLNEKRIKPKGQLDEVFIVAAVVCFVLSALCISAAIWSDVAPWEDKVWKGFGHAAAAILFLGAGVYALGQSRRASL